MRLLVADNLARGPIQDLEILGVDIELAPSLDEEALVSAVAAGVDILVVRHTPVRAELFRAAPGLSLVIQAGSKLDALDVEEASRAGVYVATCPDVQASAVAELVMAFALALDRRLVEATEALRAGSWDPEPFRHARGLQGRRIGIAGLGAVGTRVAEVARGFGMEVFAWSRSLTKARAVQRGITACASLRELASRVDVLSLHLPAGEGTRHIIDQAVLGALPQGATLINTAHGELVDPEALAAVAPEKGLRVGLDTIAPPADAGDSIGSLALGGESLVYATPSVASDTVQAERALASEVVRIVRAFLTEEEIPNVVNVLRNTPARFALVLRSRDQVGVLANVLGVIKRHGLNIEEIKNHVFDGATAACTKLRLTGRPTDACMREIRAFEEVLHVDVIPLPNLA